MNPSALPPMSPPATALTELMLAVFRCNGRLLEQGDALVAPIGLTSARWQVLGAVALAGQALSAPQVAQAMGMSRQGALKQLGTLLASGHVARQPNPRHSLSPLYALTPLGEQAYQQAMGRHAHWAEALVQGLDAAALPSALATLNALVRQLTPAPTERTSP
ncbi:MAG: MarR family winged helix-turn-helix transcriptional regulator [Rhodoferax sp.]